MHCPSSDEAAPSLEEQIGQCRQTICDQIGLLNSLRARRFKADIKELAECKRQKLQNIAKISDEAEQTRGKLNSVIESIRASSDEQKRLQKIIEELDEEQSEEQKILEWVEEATQKVKEILMALDCDE